MKIILRLLSSLRPYLRQFTALLASILIVTAASLVTPSIIRSVIDNGLVKGDPAAVLSAGLTIVVVGLARAVFNFFIGALAQRSHGVCDRAPPVNHYPRR